MTLEQLASVRQWHLAHPVGHQLEHQVWEGITALWLAGWVGMPVALLTDTLLLLGACALLTLLPRGYVVLRHRLHIRGRLRCDWLDSLAAPRP